MYDSDYDREIIKQVHAINQRFINHQRAVGRARMINGGVEVGSGLAGGSFLNKIPIVGNFAKMFGLGETGGMELGSGRRRVYKKKGGAELDLSGLGDTGAGRKKRVYKKKGGAELLNMVQKEGGRKKLGRAITGSADTGAGRRRIYKKKGKGAEDLEGGSFLDKIPVVGNIASMFGLGETGGMATGGRKKRAHKKKGGAEDLEGGSFLDKIPVVGNIASMFGLGETGGMETGSGRKKRVYKKKGKGVEEALEGNGSKKGAKKNPWIAHVKAVASKKGISYREALKIAGNSY